MGEDSIPQQFKRLEERVERLVQKCGDLQNSNTGLKTRIKELEEALRAKDATEQNYVEEKSMIRSRMDNLVDRLDKILEPG